jgi:pimeloyl-ACP methyl ester carboxylesterase
MDWLTQLFGWIAEHESVLSGIAAAIVIVGVIAAFSSRTLGFFRSGVKDTDAKPEPAEIKIQQQIRYCRLDNGCKIAWASAGSGYPLVRSLGWFTNLELEWNSPASSPFWQALASKFQLIRYDGRGMGLSDRNVDEFSPATRLEDLEAVIEASGLEKFALFGMSEGGSTAIKYAHKYPERVSHLIIWGSFLVAPTPDDVPQFTAIARLVPKYWGSDSAAFHQMFTASFLPDGNAAQNELFNEIQRTSATPETAFKFLKSIGSVDVRDIARSVNVPTLVMHRKGDLAIPVRFGQELAAQMPNARLELLEGSNHWMAAEKPEDISGITALINDFISAQQ